MKIFILIKNIIMIRNLLKNFKSLSFISIKSKNNLISNLKSFIYIKYLKID